MVNESRYKKSLRRIYHTKFGQNIWRAFAAALNHPRARVLIDKALGAEVSRKNIPRDMVLLPKIDCSEHKHKDRILLLVPFYTPDASSVYVDSICREFSDNGYEIDAIVHNSSAWRPKSDLWSRSYQVYADPDKYHQIPRNANGGNAPNEHQIDDWAGDELVQFVAALATINQYKFCIVSYLYFSRVLAFLPPEVYRIIISHDIFTSRNQRILSSSGSDLGFFFSVDADQERLGLARADLVLAIREEDQRYFSEQLKLPKVVTLPYLPRVSPDQIARTDELAGRPLRVGFLASSHRPNVDAISGFITAIADLGGLELYVAGSVCGELAGETFAANIHVVGFVDKLADFYQRCDIIINPDMLDSGLKIKSIEALAYSKPLVCTTAASAGLRPDSKYHRANSIGEVVDMVAAIITDPNLIEQVREAGAQLYQNYCERYEGSNRIEEYQRLAREKTDSYSKP